jgi:transmembrane sensor
MRYRKDKLIFDQAAEWMIKVHAGMLTPEDQQAFDLWAKSSNDHTMAWQQAERLMGTIGQVPSNAPVILQASHKHQKRVWPKMLLMSCGALVIVYVTQAESYVPQIADYSTRVGERTQVTLKDNTSINVNTGTSFDVAFTDEKRKITLYKGEILVKTGKETDRPYRPFIVKTHYGELQALGTVFNVRQDMKQLKQTCLAVMESAVKVTLAKERKELIVKAGEEVCFDAQAYHDVQQLDASQYTWQNGILMAYKMPLRQFVHELNRYKKAYIHLDPSIADIQVSGSFPVYDHPQLDYILQQNYPVKVSYSMGGYYMNISKKE